MARHSLYAVRKRNGGWCFRATGSCANFFWEWHGRVALGKGLVLTGMADHSWAFGGQS